eukprot:gb/GECG01015756.1/.p1 GENE.gb/GECG01015756.1/~~gb/GECG01015756.1/.p1  ORF type:complete len:145 (+),score=18.08 gb/GECG01015756.1/:1-435(+)
MYFSSEGESNKKSTVASILAGVLFGAAWWFYIGATSYCREVKNDSTTSGAAGYSWVPGVGATIAFIMINGMDWNELQGESSGLPGGDQKAASKAKLFLFSAIVIGLAALAASIFIFSAVYEGGDEGCKIGGVSVIVQTLVIFAG